MLKLAVHVTQAMHDEVDRRRNPLRNRHLAKEMIVSLSPIFERIGQAIVVDDDENIIVREIAADRVFDPVAARIGTVKDDLEDTPLLLPFLRGEAGRILEFGEQDLDDPFEIAAFPVGQMIEAGFHFRS